LDFGFLSFEFVSDLEFRASCFPCLGFGDFVGKFSDVKRLSYEIFSAGF